MPLYFNPLKTISPLYPDARMEIDTFARKNIYVYKTLTPAVLFFCHIGIAHIEFPFGPLSAFLIPLCNSYTNPISVFFFALDGPLLSSWKQPLSGSYTVTKQPSLDVAGEYLSLLIFSAIVTRVLTLSQDCGQYVVHPISNVIYSIRLILFNICLNVGIS